MTVAFLSRGRPVALLAAAATAVTTGLVVSTPATAAPPDPADTGTSEAQQEPLRFDFGPGTVADGYTQVTADSTYSEETGFGFTGDAEVTGADRGGEDPIKGDFLTPAEATFVVDLPNLDYTVSLVAGDSEEATQIAISSEQMQKVQTADRGPGEYLEMNYDIALVDGQMSFTFTGDAPNINAIVITAQEEQRPGDVPTAFLTGDSTMQTYDEYWEPQAGWGQVFDQFVPEGVVVDNQSIGGRSSKTFVTEGRLDAVLLEARPGDYVFAQFGHNDATQSRPERYTTPEEYQGYLRIFVEGARQRGATPVLITPVNRLDYDAETGKFNESFPEYVAAMKEVAAASDVDLIDLSASSRAYLDEIGPEMAESVFLHVPPGVYPNRPEGTQDDTHFQSYGAIQMARLVALDLAELDLPVSELVQVTEPDELPAAPAGVAVQTVTSASVTLTWDAVDGADVYRVFRSESGADEFTLAGTSTLDQALIGGLEEGVAYDFRVSAMNGLGEGEVSETVSATTRSAEYKFDFQPAGAPVADGYTEVNRSTLYTPELGYGLVDAEGMDDRDRGDGDDDVARDFVIEFGGRYEFLVDLPNGSYSAATVVGDLLGSVRTNIEIEGRDYGGQSAREGHTEKVHEDIVVTDGQLNLVITGQTAHLNRFTLTPILVAPESVQLENLTMEGASGQVELSWPEAPEAESYRVYRTGPDGEATLVGETEGTTLTDDEAHAGVTYSYAVTTVTASGEESVPSVSLDVEVVDPDVAVPAAPTGLAYTSVTKNAVELFWDESTEALFYLVERAEDTDDDFTVVGRTEDATFTDETVLTTIEYYYRVVAVNAGGASEPSAVIETPGETELVRDAEYLDRSPVAVTQDQGVYLGWRMLGLDPAGIAFHVYRDGERITDEPITDSTNYVDTGGAADSVYRISQVLDDGESWATDEFSPWAEQYLDVPLEKPADAYTKDGQPYSYSAGDASVGDVDGDGELEIILIWNPSNAKDNSQAGYTGNVYVDAYKLDGARLWRIDLGVNIRAGAHYTQAMVYDLDSDGRAEVVMKTGDGTVDGQGTVIGDADADWRNSSGYILTGPEYLTVFDGESGAAIDTVDYIPPRGDVESWGDGYGNRVDRFLAAVAYLDGEHPSVIFSRGYYTRAVVAAFDFDGEQLTSRWVLDSSDPGNGDYAGQGNHNLSVGDVDEDGKDEIVFGSATIDDDGTGLYSTGLGHGDALHLGDLDPSRAGLEVFAVHEDMGASGNLGSTFRDAATGEVLWSTPAEVDTGRGAAADIDPRHEGAEAWSVGGDAAWNSPEGYLMSADGEQISTDIPAANFVTWWDGDLLREITDHEFDETSRTGEPVVYEWDYENNEQVEIFRPEGVLTNNDTKGNPSLQADLFGDWREELVYRTEDSSALRIFTTTDVTDTRLRTLMSDPVYRLGIAWQLTGYNQPPHTSYFLGEGMETPAAPSIAYTTEPPAPEPVPGPATSAPARGELSTTSGWAYGLADGNYTVSMNLWWGQNANEVRVYENGELIGSSLLTDDTPAAQEFSVDVSGRANGSYTYTCELENQHGVSECAPVTVQVTDAEPGQAVLSADNWDGDGQYTVTANLWWGTNATEYRLYEDGELIDSQELTAHTPDAQSAVTEISGQEPGTYTYVAELVNDAGSTETEAIEVDVD